MVNIIYAEPPPKGKALVVSPDPKRAAYRVSAVADYRRDLQRVPMMVARRKLEKAVEMATAQAERDSIATVYVIET